MEHPTFCLTNSCTSLSQWDIPPIDTTINIKYYLLHPFCCHPFPIHISIDCHVNLHVSGNMLFFSVSLLGQPIYFFYNLSTTTSTSTSTSYFSLIYYFLILSIRVTLHKSSIQINKIDQVSIWNYQFFLRRFSTCKEIFFLYIIVSAIDSGNVPNGWTDFDGNFTRR